MRNLLATVLTLLLVTAMGFAQTFRGAINGTVTDPSGAVVAGAKVKATNTATAVALDSVTTSDGQFAFQDLPLGSYKIEVSAAGFRPSAVDNVSVTAGGVFTLTVKMAAGSTGTTVVEVSAAALALDTTTAAQDNILPTESVSGRSHERPRLHPVRRSSAGIRRILRRRFRIAQRHPRQPDELAD